MSSFLNRLKNLKTGSINSNNNDGDSASISSFDEEGFLCPVCHRKFPDINSLEYHYSQSHSSPTPNSPSFDLNNGNSIDNSVLQEINMWREQFLGSEQSRMTLSNDFMQQKKHVGDLEEELEALRKELQTKQSKLIEQSKEIANLKATKDVYDAQFAIFTDELLNTQGELKEKQQQVDTLCNDLIPRPTTDDVDVLKQELIAVQQRMNDMALEKEQQVENLRQIINENSKKLEDFEPILQKNNLVYNEIIDDELSELANQWNSIRNFLKKIRQRKEFVENYSNSLRSDLDQLKLINQQLENDLQQKIELNVKTAEEFQNEKKQNQSNQKLIDQLNEELRQHESTINQLKEEKNQYFLNKIENNEDEQNQKIFQRLNEEKDQIEQKVKELRKELKEIQQEKDKIQEDFQEEKKKHETTKFSFDQRLIELENERERQIEKLKEEQSEQRHQIETNFLQLKNSERQKFDEDQKKLTEEFEALKFSSKTKIEELEKKIETNRIQYENELEKKIETNRIQYQNELDGKEIFIDRLLVALRRSFNQIRKSTEIIENQIFPGQKTILEKIRRFDDESQKNKQQTIEEINLEYRNYFCVLQKFLNSVKIQQENLNEQNRSNLEKLEKNSEEKIKQIEDLFQNEKIRSENFSEKLSQICESLEQEKKLKDEQKKTLNKKIDELQDEFCSVRSDFDSRTKKYDMQINALKENLATVRTELKSAQEKLIQFDQIQLESENLQKTLNDKENEFRTVLERLKLSDNNCEKLTKNNDELTKKVKDLDSALQELAKEYQSLQIHCNTITQRRWVNDKEVHECMSCSQTFSLTQRKHHCRSCGNIFCERCSSKTTIIAATSKKPQRVCDQCYTELT